MDRRCKHLSSEERGVIFAEHERGRSQRAIGRLLGRPASTIGRELARGRRADGRYCPQRRAAPTIRGARAAGAGASWPKAARFTASCMTTSSIGAGRPSRSRRDCGA
jgi:hypothetical protein